MSSSVLIVPSELFQKAFRGLYLTPTNSSTVGTKGLRVEETWSLKMSSKFLYSSLSFNTSVLHQNHLSNYQNDAEPSTKVCPVGMVNLLRDADFSSGLLSNQWPNCRHSVLVTSFSMRHPWHSCPLIIQFVIMSLKSMYQLGNLSHLLCEVEPNSIVIGYLASNGVVPTGIVAPLRRHYALGQTITCNHNRTFVMLDDTFISQHHGLRQLTPPNADLATATWAIAFSKISRVKSFSGVWAIALLQTINRYFERLA